MHELSRIVLDYVKDFGACASGIVTTQTLAGGPPSADLSYVLPGAKSAVSFAVPLDQSKIDTYLGKKDRRSHELDNFRSNAIASGISLNLADYLRQKGHPSAPVVANEAYREEAPGGVFDMIPEISLRYLAVRSGVGYFGLSGNVITKNEGAAVILGATVTTADLQPTDPLPEGERYCDECKLCMAACASKMMREKEKNHVSLGGIEFAYSKRGNYHRCEFVCGGFTGLHPAGKWSTWSPGRFPIPEKDGEFLPALGEAIGAWLKWPEEEGGHYHVLMGKKLHLTCGNCQLICHPDRLERKRRYKLLTKSGVVMQNSDGSVQAVLPAEAKKRLAAMTPATRALYEKVESRGEEAAASRAAG